jgi:predicted MPP superfamily phosphohydrolase
MKNPPPSNPPPPLSRRRFLRNLAIGLALPSTGALYATQIEPFWPQFHELPMPVKNLPPAFEGLRIAHLSDLHVSNSVPVRYIRAVIREVNRLRPDIAFVTGDLVTRHEGWIDEACEAVAMLEAPTYVSLGNHDYGQLAYKGRIIEVAQEIQRRLEAAGQTVLRNTAVPLRRGVDRLWIMGLEDLWSGRFAPAQAFATLDSNSPTSATAMPPILALSHNPDTAAALDTYGASWIFAGHTHGGQIRVPGYGALLLPVQDKRLQQGLHQFPKSQLYISRGIGFLARARLFCRPEVPIFTMTRANA